MNVRDNIRFMACECVEVKAKWNKDKKVQEMLDMFDFAAYAHRVVDPIIWWVKRQRVAFGSRFYLRALSLVA